jgi:hypothetical protein
MKLIYENPVVENQIFLIGTEQVFIICFLNEEKDNLHYDLVHIFAKLGQDSKVKTLSMNKKKIVIQHFSLFYNSNFWYPTIYRDCKIKVCYCVGILV